MAVVRSSMLLCKQWQQSGYQHCRHSAVPVISLCDTHSVAWWHCRSRGAAGYAVRCGIAPAFPGCTAVPYGGRNGWGILGFGRGGVRRGGSNRAPRPRGTFYEVVVNGGIPQARAPFLASRLHLNMHLKRVFSSKCTYLVFPGRGMTPATLIAHYLTWRLYLAAKAHI